MIYELAVVLQNEAALPGIQELFKKEKVTVKNEDVWGKRRLAYRIGQAVDGYYVIYQLEMAGAAVKTLSNLLTANKEVLRYLFTKI